MIGEVVLFDFQTYDCGLACNEFTHFVSNSYNIKNYGDVEDLAKGTLTMNVNLNQTLNLAVSVYHHSLCENGVKDYSLENFLIDVQIAICEQALQLVKTVNDLTPSSFEKMMIQFSGEEKAKDMMKQLESGAFVRPVLVLTSLYVKDKEKFLIVN